MMGTKPFAPQRFVANNYIDAMALIAKDAWARVGGYNETRLGWQDYELWCRFVERGFWGVQVRETLCEYRAHGVSMRNNTDSDENQRILHAFLHDHHPWMRVNKLSKKQAIEDLGTAPNEVPKPLPDDAFVPDGYST